MEKTKLECRRCHKEIKEKDDYVRTTDFNLGVEGSTLYHHRKCWFELWNGTQTNKLQNIVDKVFPMIMKKATGEDN
jgi:hypothetical protein